MERNDPCGPPGSQTLEHKFVREHDTDAKRDVNKISVMVHDVSTHEKSECKYSSRKHRPSNKNRITNIGFADAHQDPCDGGSNHR